MSAVTSKGATQSQCSSESSGVSDWVLDRRYLLGAGFATTLSTVAIWGTQSLGNEIEPRRDLDRVYDREVDQAIRDGLNFLISRQKEDGTFESREQGRWVGVVSLAGLAFLSRGVRCGVGKAGLALQRAGEYVLSQVQASGFVSSQGKASHGPMYDHGFGTLFLAELFGMAPQLEIRPKLERAIRLITRTQKGTTT